MATDAFTGSNGTQLTSYSGNWTLGNALASDFVIDTNAVRTPFNRCITFSAYYAGTYANDQYAQGVIAQVGSAGQYMGVCVRANAGDGYALYADATHYVLQKLVNYSVTQLVVGSLVLVANDVLRLEASGTTITAKHNGATLTSVTDSSHSAGSPGISGAGCASSGTYTLLDDWEGADLSLPTPQWFQYDWPHQLHARR